MDESQETRGARLRRVLSDEDGQAAVEYVIIVAFVVLALAAVFGAFPYVMRDYYRELARILALPLP